MATVKSSQVVNSRAKVQVYLVTNDKYMEPVKGIYQDRAPGRISRTTTSDSSSSRRPCSRRASVWDGAPDVIHCNDWQTALIPAFLKELYAKDNFFAHTRVVFTIHNLAYQGSSRPRRSRRRGCRSMRFRQAGWRHPATSTL